MIFVFSYLRDCFVNKSTKADIIFKKGRRLSSIKLSKIVGEIINTKFMEFSMYFTYTRDYIQ